MKVWINVTIEAKDMPPPLPNTWNEVITTFC